MQEEEIHDPVQNKHRQDEPVLEHHAAIDLPTSEKIEDEQVTDKVHAIDNKDELDENSEKKPEDKIDVNEANGHEHEDKPRREYTHEDFMRDRLDQSYKPNPQVDPLIDKKEGTYILNDLMSQKYEEGLPEGTHLGPVEYLTQEEERPEDVPKVDKNDSEKVEHQVEEEQIISDIVENNHNTQPVEDINKETDTPINNNELTDKPKNNGVKKTKQKLNGESKVDHSGDHNADQNNKAVTQRAPSKRISERLNRQNVDANIEETHDIKNGLNKKPKAKNSKKDVLNDNNIKDHNIDEPVLSKRSKMDTKPKKDNNQNKSKAEKPVSKGKSKRGSKKTK